MDNTKDKKVKPIKNYVMYIAGEDKELIERQKKCRYRAAAIQGQTTTKKWRDDNVLKCEHCGAIFEFDDETGYFFHS